MLWKVTVMRQQSSSTYHASILVQSNNEKKVRQWIQTYPGIIVLSIDKREQAQDAFGDTYIRIPYGTSFILAISDLPIEKKTIYTFFHLQIPIDTIYNTETKRTKKKIEQIMKDKQLTTTQQNKNQHTQTGSGIASYQSYQHGKQTGMGQLHEDSKSGYTRDNNKQTKNNELLDLIDGILQDIHNLQTHTYEGVTGKTKRELLLCEGHLKKAKNINNQDKMRKVILATLPVVEKAEIEHRQHEKEKAIQREHEQNRIGDIEIQEIHQTREHTKNKHVYIQASKKSKIRKKGEKARYTYHMFASLLHKQAHISFQKNVDIIYTIGNIFVYICISIAITGAVRINVYKRNQGGIPQYLYENLLMIGVRGLSLQICLSIQSKRVIIAILQLVLGCVLAIWMAFLLWLHMGLSW